MAKRGLYANIHAKRKRIKAGSGEKMRKPGAKGAPTNANFKRAAKTAKKKKKQILSGDPNRIVLATGIPTLIIIMITTEYGKKNKKVAQMPDYIYESIQRQYGNKKYGDYTIEDKKNVINYYKKQKKGQV